MCFHHQSLIELFSFCATLGVMETQLVTVRCQPVAHHAGVVIGLLGWVDRVELRQVGRECFGAVYQHLLQAC